MEEERPGDQQEQLHGRMHQACYSTNGGEQTSKWRRLGMLNRGEGPNSKETSRKDNCAIEGRRNKGKHGKGTGEVTLILFRLPVSPTFSFFF